MVEEHIDNNFIMTYGDGLSDINIDDIDSFEIVKGASAASLYGSRAGNGVIVISSKRGKKGKTEITFRNELGYNEITRTIPVNQSHGFVLASDWQSFQGQYTKLDGVTYPAGFASVYAAGGAQGVGGSPIQEADGYHDNPFGVYNDHHSQLLLLSPFLLPLLPFSYPQSPSCAQTLFQLYRLQLL